MHFKEMKIFGITVLAVFALVSNVFAAGSGAYRVETPNAATAGKGYAFVGQSNDPSAVYYNPAGLTQLEGSQVSVGGTVIQPYVDHTSPSGEKTKMRRKASFVPHMYFVSDFGLDKWGFGFGGTSLWGTGTDWAADSFSKYTATKAELKNRDIMLTAAYQVNNKLSIGAGLVYDDSFISKQKQFNQGASADANIQLKAKDDGFGYTVSTLYKINDRHQVGLQYRSIIEEKFKGKIHLNGLNAGINPAIGAPLNVIFGGGGYTTDIEADQTLPQSLVVGYSFRPNEKWTFNFDVEWTDWSSTEVEDVNYPNESDATRLSILNSGDPVPRDYDDVFSIATGLEYSWSDKLRLRGGYFWHQTPIHDENFNSNLPDADSHSITTGVGYDINANASLDLAYSAMFFNDRNVSNGGTINVDGKYEEFVNLWSVTTNYKF